LSFFITLEGVEFSGKSTQAERLTAYLKKKGFEVVKVFEPGSTSLGERVREILLHFKDIPLFPLAELFLFESARAQLVAEVIKPALNEGKIVICDRFTDSTLAYQVYGRGLERELVEKLNELATQGVSPDLTFYLRVPLERVREKREKRKGLDRFEEEDLDFHRRVEEGYEKLAREFSSRIVAVDFGNVDEVFSRLVQVLEEKLPGR